MPDWGNAASVQRYIDEIERREQERLTALKLWRQGERTAGEVRPVRPAGADSPYAAQAQAESQRRQAEAQRRAQDSIYAEQIRQRIQEQQQRAMGDYRAGEIASQGPGTRTQTRPTTPAISLPVQQVSGPMGQSGLGQAAPLSSSLAMDTVQSGWRAPQAQPQPSTPRPQPRQEPLAQAQTQAMGGGAVWDKWVTDAVDWWRQSAAGQAAAQRWQAIVEPPKQEPLPSMRTAEGWQQYGLMAVSMPTASESVGNWLIEQAKNAEQPGWFRAVAAPLGEAVRNTPDIPQMMPFEYLPKLLPGLAALWSKGADAADNTSIGKAALMAGGGLMTGLQAGDDTLKIMPLPGKGEYTAGQFLSSLGRAVWDNPWLIVDGVFLGGRATHEAKMRYMEAYDRAAGGPGAAANGSPKQWALLNVYSDPKAVQATYNDLMMVENKAGVIAGLTQQAQQAQASGDALKAAEIGAQIEWWKNVRPVDVVDKHTELLPELVFTMLFDWTNLIGFGFDLAKLGPQSRRMASAVKAATADEGTVLRSLEEAIATTQAAKLRNGDSLLGAAKAGPAEAFVGLTNEARATQQAADLFTFFTQLLGDVKSVEDARLLVAVAAQKPQELITGLRGLTGMGDVLQADGAYKVGAGLFNTRVIEAVPTLLEARQTLLNLPSLNAEKWNPLAALAEIHDALFASAYRVHRLADWAMPQGTKAVRAVDIAPGPMGMPQQAIEYLDEQGNVISRSAAMKQAEAQGEVNKLSRWIAEGRTENPAYTALRAPDRLVRGFISSAFLNLMPGHWVRNAVSGMGHLMTDGVMTFEKTDDAIGFIANQFGGALPLTWMREAFQATGEEGATASAKAMGAPARGSWWDWLGKGNLLSRADAAGSEVWTGGGSIAGRVPVGEMNMRLRGFVVPFRRGLQEEWGKVVTRQLGPVLDGLGVDGKTKRKLISAVVDAAVYGNKREVVPAVRRFLDGTASSVDMQALGLANGSISPDAYRTIRQVLDVYMTSGDRAAAERAINEALDAEQLLFARILADTPAQPGRQTFTELENVQDFGELLRDVEHAARKAGADPAEATRPVQELITQYKDMEPNGYAALMQLAAEQPTPQVRALLFDTWAQIYDAKIAARQRQGALARAAMEDPALWQVYPQQITEVWREFFTTQERLFQEAMGLMTEAQAGRYVSSAPAGSHGLLEKLASIDTDAAMRQMGQVPKGLHDPEYQAIIDAGRSFQDQAAATMYTVALRYGEDVNAFDHVISAEIDVRRMSAAAAAKRAEIAAKYPDLRNAKIKRQYYKEMSELWGDFWFATSGRYHAASMEITTEFVTRRLAPDASFVEPWADPFGRTLTLLEPVETAQGRRWRVLDMDKKTVADDLIAEDQIPPEAIQAWERAMSGPKVRQQAAEMVAQVHSEGRVARGEGRPATMPPPNAGAKPATMPDPWSGGTPEQVADAATRLANEAQQLQKRLDDLAEEAAAIVELLRRRLGGSDDAAAAMGEPPTPKPPTGGAPAAPVPPSQGSQLPSVRGLLSGPTIGEGLKLLPAPRSVAPTGPVQGTAADSSLVARLQQRLDDIEQEKAFYRELLMDVESRSGLRGEVQFQDAPRVPTKEEIAQIGQDVRGTVEVYTGEPSVSQETLTPAASAPLTRPESMRAAFAPGDQVQLPNGKTATVKSATATSVTVEVQTKTGKPQTKRFKPENVTLVERAAPPAKTVEEGMALAAGVPVKAGDDVRLPDGETGTVVEVAEVAGREVAIVETPAEDVRVAPVEMVQVASGETVPSKMPEGFRFSADDAVVKKIENDIQLLEDMGFDQNSPTPISKARAILYGMGETVAPGVRPQDAVEAGRLYYLLTKGAISEDDWTKFVQRLWKENRINDEEAFRKLYPTVAGAAASVDEATGKYDIVGYEWRTREGERYSAYEGGLAPGKISDWDKSEISAPTGRKIVHVYWVREPDGTVRPYGKQAAAKAMGWSEAQIDRKAAKYVQQAMAEVEQAKAWARDFDLRPKFDDPVGANEAYLSIHKHPSVSNADVWMKDGKYTTITKGKNGLAQAARAAGWENLGDAEAVAGLVQQRAAMWAKRTGRTTQGWSDPARKVEMQYEVIELDDLVASHTADGRINPQYPAELQPRDRSQAASQLQVREIAGNLAPEELLSETNAIDRGAPIVGAGNIVESGNGRTMALRSLDDAQFAPYRAMLLERAQQFGIDPAAVEGMRRPVLVRRRLTEVDPVQFAAEANARTTLGMNMAEQSGLLANALRPNDLQQFHMGAADTLRQALAMQQNQDFVRRVLAAVPANERAMLVDANGMLTTQGTDAIRAALFHKVFGANPEILRNYIQAPKPELANVGNGLERAVAMLAQLAEVNPQLALGDDLATAASMLMELRRSGTPVETRLNQLGMFEQISEEAKELLRFLDANARSGRKIGDMLTRYAESALLYDPNQLGMFAQVASNKLAMLQTAIRRAEEGGQSLGLFDSPIGIVLQPGVPLELKALWAKLRKAQAAGPTTAAPAARPKHNFGGVADLWPASLWDVMSRNDKRIGMAGNLRQPTIGDVAAFRVEDIDQLRRRLLNELDNLTAAPNTLTNQQKLQVLGAVQQLMPQYDNVLAGVTKGAQAISDFAMLDYGKVHGFDTAIALHTPFHFWFTRSAKNWLERSLLKPSVLASYLRIKRTIDQQNERENTPARMSGTIGIPGTQIRIANPYNLLIPYQTLYELSDFGEETPNPTAVQRFVETAKLLGFGMNPLYDSLYKVANGRGQEIQAGDFAPQYRLINYLYKTLTGNELPGAGDEYDPYRDARTLARMVQAGAIDQNTARWLQDRLYQRANGVEPLPEEAAQEKAIWDRLTQEAAQASGFERLVPLLTRSLLGVTAYSLPQEEQDIRQMQAARRGLGYGPDNAFGSQAAVDAFDAQSGYDQVQGAWMGKDALIPQTPGAQTPAPPTYPFRQPYTPTRPGVAAVDAQKKEAKAAIRAEMNAAVEAALAENPRMTPAQLKELKAPFYDRLDALDLAYPSATNWAEQGPRDFYGNMNPAELLESARQSIVYRALDELAPMKPQAGAPRQAWDAYNAALEQRVAELMNDPQALSAEVYGRPVDVGAMGEGRGATPMPPALPTAGSVSQETPQPALPVGVQPGQRSEAQALIDSVLGKNTTPAEQAYWERRDAEFAAKDAMWAQRKATVYATFGEDVGKAYEEYLALPSGSQARKDYKAQHPELRAVSLLVYHPQEYGQMAELFGQDGITAWAKLPPASDRKARAAYYDANPKAFLVQAWVYGRPGKQDEQDTAADEAFRYSFGADYKTAEEKFGADIWQVVAGYRRGWDKATKAAYYRQNAQLSPFFDWWYGNLDEQPSVSPYANVGRAWSGGGGGGGGWSGGGGWRPQVRMPEVWAREMDRSLWNTDTSRYAYQPPRVDLSWLRAGDRVGPEPIRKWRRERLW